MRRNASLPNVCRCLLFLAPVFLVGVEGLAQQGSGGSVSPGPVTAKSAATASPVTATAERNTKQFRVFCEDPDVRLAFSSFADSVDRDFRQLIRDTSDWIYPVLITVKGSLSDVDPGVSAVNRIDLLPDGQFSLQVGIRLSSDFLQESATRETLRVLLYERMLRPFQSSPDDIAGKKIDAPPWLLHGVEQLIEHRRNGRPSDFFAGIVQSRQLLSAREILDGDPERLDSLSAAVFKASAAALIAALLDQSQGHQHFQEFLGDLAGADSEAIEPLIRQHFPGLRGSVGAIEKWWSLQVAHMGQKQAVEFLTAEETDVLLEEGLRVRFGPEPTEEVKGFGKLLPKLKPDPPFEGTIRDFDRFIGRRDAAKVLGENRLKLRGLSMRCFPLYRNVVLRYESAVVLLINGKKRGVRSELEEIEKDRASVRATMVRVVDTLNHFEATQGEGNREAFENYRETRKRIERQRRPERSDRISKYLDALEEEFRGEDIR